MNKRDYDVNWIKGLEVYRQLFFVASVVFGNPHFNTNTNLRPHANTDPDLILAITIIHSQPHHTANFSENRNTNFH